MKAIKDSLDKAVAALAKNNQQLNRLLLHRREPIATPDQLTLEKKWLLRITELDLEQATAKVRFVDDDGIDSEARVQAAITDPFLNRLDNQYVNSLTRREPLIVYGRAMMRDGSITTLYISHCEGAYARR